MTRLSSPDPRLFDSWAAAVREFDGGRVHGSGIGPAGPHGQRSEVELTAEGCARLVADLDAQADPARERPDWQVPSNYYWITDGDPAGVVGFLALRHRLTPYLLDEGGHIGYSVRPGARRRGHAGRALRLGVSEAAGLGLDRVLVMCDETNEGSRRTIEGAGGLYEDTRFGRRRYWITTAR